MEGLISSVLSWLGFEGLPRERHYVDHIQPQQPIYHCSQCVMPKYNYQSPHTGSQSINYSDNQRPA